MAGVVLLFCCLSSCISPPQCLKIVHGRCEMKRASLASQIALSRRLPPARARTERLWVATVTSTAPVVNEHTGSDLELTVVDKEGEARSAATRIDGSWERFTQNGGNGGWARRGLVSVPDSIHSPGAVLVRKIGDNSQDQANTLDYIRSVKLATCVVLAGVGCWRVGCCIAGWVACMWVLHI